MNSNFSQNHNISKELPCLLFKLSNIPCSEKNNAIWTDFFCSISSRHAVSNYIVQNLPQSLGNDSLQVFHKTTIKSLI